MPEHCVVDIENGDVWLTPIDGARWVSTYSVGSQSNSFYIVKLIFQKKIIKSL